MAKSSGGGMLHAGLTMKSPVNSTDPSRMIKSKASVNDGATRDGVAKQPNNTGSRTA